MEPSKVLKLKEILERTNDTLEAIWSKFEVLCPKCLYFQMGQWIATLIEQTHLLDTEYEVMNSVFLLCQLAPVQHLNPFNKVLYNYVNRKPTTSKSEAALYMLSLLPFSPTTLALTTKQLKERITPVKMPLKNFQYTPKADCTVPVILDDPEHSAADDEGLKDTLVELLEQNVAGAVFSPPYVRLKPPLYYDESENEPFWMWPNDNEYTFQWDPNIDLPNGNGGRETDLKTLFHLSLRQPLTPAQYERVKAALKADEAVSLDVAPHHIPKLVNKNPSLAVDVLLTLAQTPQFGDFLHVLINLELSLHSMEVVNKITANLDLPPQFIHFYIRNCISECTNIQDKHTQHRFVRLVCVFLTALIRNRLVNVKDVLVEIQAFCIDHSRIREATGLFRLLQTLDSKDN